jgi:hypothetical protein
VSEQGIERQFSSRELTDGDIFTATLIRPGIYTAINQNDNSKLEIMVPYPKRVTKKPVLKPVIVECTGRAIIPGNVEVQPGCAIIFQIKTRSRITIELKTPIDRPDLFRAPEDVPRSVERRVLSVINSSMESDFLTAVIDTGKGMDTNRKLAAKVVDTTKRTGRITEIGQIFKLEKMEAKEFTAVINSLDKAYNQLTDKSRFRQG